MVDIFIKSIIKELSKASSRKIDESMLEIPPNPRLGDYAFPCFSLSKNLKKTPFEIANDLAEKIKPNEFISKIQVTGPYLNFFVKKETLAKNVLKDIYKKKSKYGSNQIKNKTVLLEGWQPNTHKAFHIGHIRNTVLSEALSRVLEFYGWKVIRCSYMGDIGAHVAKWIWYYKRFYRGQIPKNNVSKWAGEIYTKASIKAKEDKIYEEEINEVHKRLEDGDEELVKLWKTTRELCLKDFWKIFKELDSKIERPYFESEVEQPGIKKVKELAEKKIAKKSEGAIIINLEKYKLGIFVLLKSNGASLYSTKDIALAYLKSKEYKFDLKMNVVASEQDFYFRQLIKTLEIIGYKDAKKFKHASYGLVKLKEGKMSSRLGNIILYEDFRDKLFKKVEKQIKDRKLNKTQKEKIMKSVAFGAMKFTMLNQDSQREIIFDYDKSLSFEGETGPYVQYTHARAYSVLNKFKGKLSTNVDYGLFNTEEDKSILKLLEDFPYIVEKAAEDYKPSYITRYLLDLSQVFNEYYHKHQILQDNKEIERARMLLVNSVKEILEIGLNLLGIKAPDVM